MLIEIPAPSGSILSISTEPEIIVGFGCYYHRHFDIWPDRESEANYSEAIDFIRHIIAGEILIATAYDRDGEWRGGSCFPKDGAPKLPLFRADGIGVKIEGWYAQPTIY